jgi:SOS-response transcriptional repressor LexA
MQVVGDSMTGDGIREGDLIVVDPGPPARDGDIADIRVIWRAEHTGRRNAGSAIRTSPVA